MVENKKVNDIVFHLNYNSHQVTECKITRVNNDGSYNLITSYGEDKRKVKSWHLYNTREEAEKQSPLYNNIEIEKDI